jgi:hypothetical protein
VRPGPSARRRGVRAAAAALLLASAACNNTPQETVGPSAPPDATATFTRVQREVFTPSCALPGCHAASSPKVGLILEAGRSYGSLVGVVSVETSLLRVMAGLPNDSYLVVKLRADASIVGDRMPPGSPTIPSGQLQLVVDWIRRGAPND